MKAVRVVWIESSRNTKELEKLVRSAGFRIDPKDPQVVISYGGDGSILKAEEKHPGTPILPIRESTICAKCPNYGPEKLPGIMERLSEGEYGIYDMGKVEADKGGEVLEGLNEVQVRTELPTHALRFSIEHGKLTDAIGDGFVAATSHGSTAYYRSIGCKPFSKGIMLGFNNIWPPKKPIEVKGDVQIKIIRGKGLLAADNNENTLKVVAGESMTVRASRKVARFVRI